jgi:hypothetical protein
MNERKGFEKRCRLYWLTNSTLVYEPMQMRVDGGGGGGVGGTPTMLKYVHREKKKTFEKKIQI